MGTVCGTMKDKDTQMEKIQGIYSLWYITNKKTKKNLLSRSRLKVRNYISNFCHLYNTILDSVSVPTFDLHGYTSSCYHVSSDQ